MASRRILYISVILGSLAEAIPTVTFPINSQVPPVARVSESFSYVFSSSTFYSDLPLSYRLSTAPSWLSLDANTRTLSGTPSVNDVGPEDVTGFSIEITASDQFGSVTSNATIVISKNPSPVIGVPLSSQIPTFGDAISTPSKLLYHPSTPFKITFDPATFSNDGTKPALKYYGISTNNTPLPFWIHFDVASLSFSGQTPDYASLIQPPQTFGIQLVASDVEGFSGSSIPFSIEVGVHLLAFKNTYMVMNVTTEVDQTFDGLAKNLELNGAIADPASILSIDADLPPWLVLDNSTLIITGRPPPDAISSNITVQAKDTFGDIANATVYINVASDIFSGTIGILNATDNTRFSFNIGTYLRNSLDTSLEVHLSQPLPWVSFDPQTFILSGQVPEMTSPMEIVGTLNATSRSTQVSRSQSFTLSIIEASSQSLSPTPSSTTSAINPMATTAVPGQPVAHKGPSMAIFAGIGIPVTFIMLLLLVVFLCYRKRRKAARRHLTSVGKSETSVPLDEASMMVDNIRFNPIQAPEPLPLDTSGFGDATSVYSADSKPNSNGRNIGERIKHSRTMSTTLIRPPLASTFNDGARDSSEASLSKPYETISWRLEANGSVSSIGPVNVSTQRPVRNYSRKGHARRSGRVWPSDATINDSTSSIQPGDGRILNVNNGSFSSAPMANFTTISSSIPEMPEYDLEVEVPIAARAARRNSRFSSHLERTRSGIGHGGRVSVSSISFGAKRRSIGQSQDWSQGFQRDSKTWVTFNTGESQRNRLSYSSYRTDSTDLVGRQPSAKTSATPVSSALTRVSASGLNARPISRRIVGASPFFHGRSTSRASKLRSPQKARMSYADSPTVPAEIITGNLGGSSSEGVQDENTPRISSGVIFRSTRESTKELRSYLHSQLHKSKTRSRNSMRSTESRDSRFESASPSLASLHRFQSTHHFDESGVDGANAEDEYEDFLPDDYSDGSWETNQSGHGSQANVVTHGPPSSDNDITMIDAPSPGDEPNLAPSIKSDLNSRRMYDIGSHARIVSIGKKPVNVGTQEIGSVRARIDGPSGEDDFTAYI